MYRFAVSVATIFVAVCILPGCQNENATSTPDPQPAHHNAHPVQRENHGNRGRSANNQKNELAAGQPDNVDKRQDPKDAMKNLRRLFKQNPPQMGAVATKSDWVLIRRGRGKKGVSRYEHAIGQVTSKRLGKYYIRLMNQRTGQCNGYSITKTHHEDLTVLTDFIQALQNHGVWRIPLPVNVPAKEEVNDAAAKREFERKNSYGINDAFQLILGNLSSELASPRNPNQGLDLAARVGAGVAKGVGWTLWECCQMILCPY